MLSNKPVPTFPARTALCVVGVVVALVVVVPISCCSTLSTRLLIDDAATSKYGETKDDCVLSGTVTVDVERSMAVEKMVVVETSVDAADTGP